MKINHEDVEKRKFDVYFLKEYKMYFNKLNRKQKSDYILNIAKIIKGKFNKDFFILNQTQAFLLNYEIKKLLDKAIKIKNKKYTKIIYINNNITVSGILNIIAFLDKAYPNLDMKYIIVDIENEFTLPLLNHGVLSNHKIEIVKKIL